MKKAPAFQFYVGDFLRGTLYFNTVEVGAYMLLLCHQWDYVFIPEDELEIITRTTKDNLVRVLKKFKKTESGYQNARLEIVREEQNNFKKAQSAKGRAGAEKRWADSTGIKKDSTGIKNDGHGHNPAIVRPMPGDSSSSSSSSSTSLDYNNNLISADRIFEELKKKAPKYFSDKLLEIKAKEIAKTTGENKIEKLGAYVSKVLQNLKPDCKVKFYNPGAASYGYMQIEEWDRIKDSTALQFEKYEAV